MKYSFVTFLGTDSFLPGVIALDASLRKYHERYNLLVLLTDLVSAGSIAVLETGGLKYKLVAQIQNPNKLENDERNFKHMYTKLRVFELTEFDKIVYIDADMLVCCNIDELFDSPHMAAVNAGALYPENASWVDLNAGFLVVEPDKALAEKMYSLVDVLYSNDGSDQGFLHTFYNDWSNDETLHLPHKYNVPAGYIDSYTRLNGFRFSYKNGVLDTNIAIIHYWGRDKPWNINPRELKRRSPGKFDQSYVFWWDTYLAATEENKSGVWEWLKKLLG